MREAIEAEAGVVQLCGVFGEDGFPERAAAGSAGGIMAPALAVFIAPGAIPAPSGPGARGGLARRRDLADTVYSFG